MKCCGCFTACDVKHSHTIQLTNSQIIVWNITQHWNLVDQVNQQKFSRANSERVDKVLTHSHSYNDWRVMGMFPSCLTGWFQDPKLVHWIMTYWGLTRGPFIVGHFDFSSSLDLLRSSQEPVLERRSCRHQTPCLWNRRLIASQYNLLDEGWEGGVVVWRCEPDLPPINAHQVSTQYLTGFLPLLQQCALQLLSIAMLPKHINLRSSTTQRNHWPWLVGCLFSPYIISRPIIAYNCRYTSSRRLPKWQVGYTPLCSSGIDQSNFRHWLAR